MKTLVYMPLSAVELTTVTSVFTCISSELLPREQAMQNAAACLITGVRRSQHMTPILQSALATNMAVYSFQDGCVGVQMSAWYGSSSPVDILHSNFITRRSVSSTLCRVWAILSHVRGKLQ